MRTSPHEIVARLMDAVPPGSYLTISDTTTDIDTERVTDGTARLNSRLGPAQSTLRTPRADRALLRRPGTRRARDRAHAAMAQRCPIPLVIPAYAGMGRKP